MKNISALFTALLMVLLCAQTSTAMRGDSLEFEINAGTVRSTGAFCPTPCETFEAKLHGTFVAQLSRAIYFSDANISTEPDLAFTLPADPENDNGGVNRSVKFDFDGQLLNVSGVIDSRAFDGPLVEYTFTAVVIDQTGDFNQRGFFAARPDFRKCVSPLCGGYFVKAVNRKPTRCADGTNQDECYVAEIEFGGTSFSPDGSLGFVSPAPLVVQGRLVAKNYDFFGNLGIFKAKAAYTAVSANPPEGRFFGIEDNGLRCITYPCFSLDQYVLNRKQVRAISSINLEDAGATAKQIESALNIIAEGRVLIASGNNQQTGGPEGKGKELVASQFYLPVEPVRCPDGFNLAKGRCVTPYGCETPLLEQTMIGGAAMLDPVTGEVMANTSKSCVSSCEFPAVESGPAQCTLALP